MNICKKIDAALFATIILDQICYLSIRGKANLIQPIEIALVVWMVS